MERCRPSSADAEAREEARHKLSKGAPPAWTWCNRGNGEGQKACVAPCIPLLNPLLNQNALKRGVRIENRPTRFGSLSRWSRNEIFRVPTGFVGKIIGRNFYNRESLVKNLRERRTLGSEEDLSLASSFFVVVLGARGVLLVGVNQNKDTSRATRTAVYTGVYGGRILPFEHSAACAVLVELELKLWNNVRKPLPRGGARRSWQFSTRPGRSSRAAEERNSESQWRISKRRRRTSRLATHTAAD